MRTLLTVPIDYDPDVTDPESLASAMDRLLETALSTPGILDEYGDPCIGEFLVSKPSETVGGDVLRPMNRLVAACRRYILFDFDRQELATTHVYDDRAEAVDDAAQSQDVIVVPLEFEVQRDTPETPAEAEIHSADSEPTTCDCELPGYFCSGVPGILAHVENGRLADGAGVERCDLCERYTSDEAARKKLVELGIASRNAAGGPG